MDRIKASPKMLGRYKSLSKKEFMRAKDQVNDEYTYGDIENRKAFSKLGKSKLDSNRKFWYSLGIDQMVHHLTHYIIIYSEECCNANYS